MMPMLQMKWRVLLRVRTGPYHFLRPRASDVQMPLLAVLLRIRVSLSVDRTNNIALVIKRLLVEVCVRHEVHAINLDENVVRL